jgi:hypothetical protein
MLEVSITVYWATWRSSPIVKLNPCDAAAAFLVCYAVASLVATLYCVATWSIVQRCASAIVKAICYAVAPASLMSSAPCQSWCLAVRASAYAWTTLLVAVFVLVLIVRTKNLRESCRQVGALFQDVRATGSRASAGLQLKHSVDSALFRNCTQTFNVSGECNVI